MTTPLAFNREPLAKLPLAQLERLSYIDFRLYFLGELRRTDLIDRFETGPAGATRDIAMYKSVASGNLDFDGSERVYRPTRVFLPVFDHQPLRVLAALSEGFGQGVADEVPLLRCETVSRLSLPSMQVLAPISRAIHRRRAVRILYHSLSSGPSEREIVPFALFDNGMRWHVRAFDRKSREFRDFVLTRVAESALELDGPVHHEEQPDQDLQWSRIIELDLVLHPHLEHPEIIRMDYDMQDGVLKVRARAAHVGYLLRSWGVDCSPDHRLSASDHPLWLRDPLAIYGASSAVVAPGYCRP